MTKTHPENEFIELYPKFSMENSITVKSSEIIQLRIDRRNEPELVDGHRWTDLSNSPVEIFLTWSSASNFDRIGATLRSLIGTIDEESFKFQQDILRNPVSNIYEFLREIQDSILLLFTVLK